MILEYMLSPATAQLLDWCRMSGREGGIFALYRMRYEEMMRKKEGLPPA